MHCIMHLYDKEQLEYNWFKYHLMKTPISSLQESLLKAIIIDISISFYNVVFNFTGV